MKGMNMNTSLRRFQLFLSLLLPAAVSLSSAQTYKITDLGDLPGGNFSQAQAINARGQIVGDYVNPDGTFHGYVAQ